MVVWSSRFLFEAQIQMNDLYLLQMFWHGIEHSLMTLLTGNVLNSREFKFRYTTTKLRVIMQHYRISKMATGRQFCK